MNRGALRLIVLAGTLAMPSSTVLAASCSIWNWQSEGVYWRTCVNDDGSQQCYRATDANGANAQEVSCS